METIGDRIKLARKKCGYTQETLAKTLYFSDKAISSWEITALNQISKVTAF